MGQIHHLTDETLNNFVNEQEIIYLNFWHENCGPCVNVVTPALEKILAKSNFPKQVKIAKMNIRDYPALAQSLGATSVPSYGIYIDGKYTGTRNGFITGIKRPINFFHTLLIEKDLALKIGIGEFLREFDRRN